jgi:DNA-directed RNA polymerase specialized sigma24 family protein
MPLGRHTSPTQAARRAERILSVREAPNGLDPIDRKALALRHLEPLSRSDAAQLLGTSHEAGTKRCFRALKRLGDMLATLPGSLEGH